mmetsp:Transcript_27086/g.87447  ORF Transcript_27086/g.87447 Transcript_27086/m.87447 type:complete len:101 (-) Transcript_27086:303-605(-)
MRLNFTMWAVSSFVGSDGMVNIQFLDEQVRPTTFSAMFNLLDVDAWDGSTYELLHYIESLSFSFLEPCGDDRVVFPHVMVNTLHSVPNMPSFLGHLPMRR